MEKRSVGKRWGVILSSLLLVASLGAGCASTKEIKENRAAAEAAMKAAQEAAKRAEAAAARAEAAADRAERAAEKCTRAFEKGLRK